MGLALLKSTGNGLNPDYTLVRLKGELTLPTLEKSPSIHILSRPATDKEFEQMLAECEAIPSLIAEKAK